MDEVIKKLNEHDEQLDTIARAVADHTERLDRIEYKISGMVTKEDNQNVMNALDEILRLTKKKDEELTVLAQVQRMHSDKIEKIEKDVKQMKPALGIG